MNRFQHDDLSIAYDRDGSGPAVLFLHNGGTSRRIWRPQMEALRDHFEVVAVDLPGFGDSPLGSQPLTLAGYADAMSAMIDSLELAPVVIVGNCMGSNIATYLAESRPDDVRALVLINPLTASTFDSGWLGPLHKLDRLAPPVAKTLRNISRKIPIPRAVVGLVLRFQLGPEGVRRGIHHDAELIACNIRPQQMSALVDVLGDMDAYGGMDSGRDLAEIPVTTIWGARNRVLSINKGERLNVTLQPDEALVFEDCGHLPMLERPDDVTRAIQKVLDSLPAADQAEARPTVQP